MRLTAAEKREAEKMLERIGTRQAAVPAARWGKPPRSPVAPKGMSQMTGVKKGAA